MTPEQYRMLQSCLTVIPPEFYESVSFFNGHIEFVLRNGDNGYKYVVSRKDMINCDTEGIIFELNRIIKCL
jgi:hypothetical protein